MTTDMINDADKDFDKKKRNLFDLKYLQAQNRKSKAANPVEWHCSQWTMWKIHQRLTWTERSHFVRRLLPES